MFLLSETKEQVTMIWIHAELIMWGDAFLTICKNIQGGIDVDWLSLYDGGGIAEKGEKYYSDVSFQKIIDYLYSLDYPEQEEPGMNVSWELRFGSWEDEEIDNIEFGCWERAVIAGVVAFLRECLEDDEPLVSLLDTLEA